MSDRSGLIVYCITVAGRGSACFQCQGEFSRELFVQSIADYLTNGFVNVKESQRRWAKCCEIPLRQINRRGVSRHSGDKSTSSWSGPHPTGEAIKSRRSKEAVRGRLVNLTAAPRFGRVQRITCGKVFHSDTFRLFWMGPYVSSQLLLKRFLITLAFINVTGGYIWSFYEGGGGLHCARLTYVRTQ